VRKIAATSDEIGVPASARKAMLGIRMALTTTLGTIEMPESSET
jgi:hypothetical protein